MHNLKLTAPADIALSKLQDTTLTPMEEALFHGWAQANGVQNPDAPNNMVDYRGIYKNSGGVILPQGQLKQIADKADAQSRLEQILHERYKQRVSQVANQTVANQTQGANSIG